MTKSSPSGSRPHSHLFTVVGLTLALWFAVAVVTIGATYSGPKHIVWTAGAYIAISLAGALLCTPVYLASRFTVNASVTVRCAAVGLVAILMAGLQSLADYGIFTVLMPIFEPGRRMAPMWQNWRLNVLIYLWVFAFYAAAAVTLFLTRKARQNERQLLLARAAADRARLEALRLQINPHFLFNALNAATSLIGLGRNAEAETVLLRLSTFFRSSLTSHSDDMVTLEMEFEDLSAYLDIEMVRFGERLSVTMEIDDVLQHARIPHFLLQPLVENAIKHGVAKRSASTHIAVSANARNQVLFVSVENEASGGSPDRNGAAGVGLRNVADRLEVIYGGQARLETTSEADRFIAVVTIPLNTEPFSSPEHPEHEPSPADDIATGLRRA